MSRETIQQKTMVGGVGRGIIPALVSLVLLLVTGCGMAEDEPPRSMNDDAPEIRFQELNSFCSVDVEGRGSIDVESEYLPGVVACENGNADFEALKAQAVAARSWAQAMTQDSGVTLENSENHQVFDCDYAQVEDRHRRAVEETAGQVLVHNDTLVYGFYVAGAIPSGGSCIGAGGNDPTNTEHHVTYNEGRIGPGVRPATPPMGNPDHPGNRGVKSQNGAHCLSERGRSYEEILRFYYGDDISVKVSNESKCSDGAVEGQAPPPTGAAAEGQTCPFAANSSSQPSCVDPSQAPDIRPRSSWNARSPNGNRAHHTPNRITVHHTVTANEAQDGATQVRNIQNFHMNSNGWSDIGYHFIISWDGTIYAGNPEDRIGAHAGGENTGNLGIAVLGSFHQGVSPSDAQIDSLTQMLRHLGDKHGIALDRSNVMGHGEWPSQSTQCPGENLRSQLDQVVNAASGDSVCQTAETDMVGESVDEFKYVRVQGLSNEPTVSNDSIDGFEVDSIFFERGSHTFFANDVSCNPDVTNPDHALGQPENQCDNRDDAVAGVPVGGDLIVELGQTMRVGDEVHVVQHLFDATGPDGDECGPTGTAKVMLSKDGYAWKVIDTSVRGNSSWQLTEEDFVFDEDDVFGVPGADFAFTRPTAGEAHHPALTFEVQTTNPDIVEVEYYVPADPEEAIDPDWLIDSSTNASTNFQASYEFQFYGERRIAARGLDSNGQEVAMEEIVITVTDTNGVIPAGETNNAPLPSGENINSSLAQKMAEEGGKCWDPANGGPRCSNGTGGYSSGLCWRFVKRALERAGINWSALQNTGPCSSYRFNLSAYGFRCNADPNPGALANIGLQRIDVPTTQAPAGAIIAWDRGCMGYHAEHGHIEISMGDGTACSDYCGGIAGDASCASVYVPVN